MTGTMDEKGVTDVASLLEACIENLGYPVGMGMAPHPDLTLRLARELIAAYLTAAAGDGGAVSVEEWPKEVDERVLIYVVHDNAQYEKDAARRLSAWEGWFTGYWTDFNAGGWVWNGMAGRVTHVASLPPPPAKP